MSTKEKVEIVIELLKNNIGDIANISATKLGNSTELTYFVGSKKGQIAITNSFLELNNAKDIEQFFKHHSLYYEIQKCEQDERSFDGIVTVSIIGSI